MNTGDQVSGRYIIRKHIGRGGMQDVYLAVDELLGVNVALKTPQAGQPASRFRKSAVIAARVNHHNVAKTFDYFEENGQACLVEEFVPGDTLETKLSEFGTIDPHLGARIFHHLAKGIAASHHAGVVHRDLKPSNVIAEAGVNLHQLKITDFGIATLTEEVFERAAQDGDLTRSTSGTIRGALPYMAPEMMFREPGDYPGPPSDIWSLGAMMFKVLSGVYPFGVYLEAAVNVKNGTRKSWPDFMTSHPQFAPLSSELQSLIEKCLEYDPAHRPTADQILNEIDDICYINVDRTIGKVDNFIQKNTSGFASDAKEVAFFSKKSIYPRGKSIKVGSRVSYSLFPGIPRRRAHPLVILE